MLKTLFLLRTQILIALAVSALLIFIGQSRELLRVFAEDRWVWQSVFGFVGLGLLAFVLWLTGRWLTILQNEEDKKAQITARAEGVSDTLPDDRPSLARWMPRICGALPLLAVSIAMAITAFETPGDAKAFGILLGSGFVTLVLAVLFIFWTHWRTAGRIRPYEFGSDFVTAEAGSYSVPLWACIAAGAFAFVLAVTVALPIRFPVLVGTFFLVFLFVAALVLLLTMSNRLIVNHRVPLVTILAVLAIFATVTGGNDNHHLRLAQSGPDPEALEFQGVEEAFELWFENREGRDETEPYPVFVIAAEGGGAYASYRTAAFLAMMQDACPTFASHVFAISGVSGGSIGAAVFADLIHRGGTTPSGAALPVAAQGVEGGCDFAKPGPLGEAVDAIFEADLLSPVAAKLLFAAPVQSVLPLPVKVFDRAKSLETSISRAVSNIVGGEDRMRDRAFADMWRPHGAVPALVLNTVEEHSGYRVPVAPFSIRAPGLRVFSDFVVPGEAPDLIEAAVLSARFPVITAPGTLKVRKDAPVFNVNADPDGKADCGAVRCDPLLFDDLPDTPFTTHFYDGGYADNSGVETALDILEDIAFLTNDPDFGPLKVHLIQLGGLYSEPQSAPRFNDLISPISALNRARTARSRINRCRSERANPDAEDINPFLCGRGVAPGPVAEESLLEMFGYEVAIHHSILDARQRSVPLGWRLSKTARTYIRETIAGAGTSGECGPDNPARCNGLMIRRIGDLL